MDPIRSSETPRLLVAITQSPIKLASGYYRICDKRFVGSYDPENSSDLSSSSSLPSAICVTLCHANRSRSPDDKLADKLDANSISRMFHRKVARGPQNENRSVFLAGSFLRVSDVSHPCNLCELISAMDFNVQLVRSYQRLIGLVRLECLSKGVDEYLLASLILQLRVEEIEYVSFALFRNSFRQY